MGRIKVAAAAAVVTVGVVLLLEHPDILTAGASLSWGWSWVGGYGVFTGSYALSAVKLFAVALGLTVICVRIRQRIRQRAIWRRRYSMRSIDGGKTSRSDDDLRDGSMRHKPDG
jgi:uncharacterized membrane protein